MLAFQSLSSFILHLGQMNFLSFNFKSIFICPQQEQVLLDGNHLSTSRSSMLCWRHLDLSLILNVSSFKFNILSSFIEIISASKYVLKYHYFSHILLASRPNESQSYPTLQQMRPLPSFVWHSTSVNSRRADGILEFMYRLF